MNKQTNILFSLITLVAVMVLVGCRGQISKKPPIHLNPNMDNQNKYRGYSENELFEDKRSMRPQVEGTISRGNLQADDAFYKGHINGEFVSNPLPITTELMARGQERYNIYCSMCHGETGSNMGIVTTKGFIPPPKYSDERILKLKDGELYDVIANGIRNMPSYKLQVPVKDRWAIVAYIRALQLSQTATIEDVPSDKRSGL